MKKGSWTRVGGVGGIVFFVSLAILIVLMPLSHSVSEPAFNASSNAFLAYAKSESELPFTLELLGVLGLFGFVVFGAAWLGWAALAIGIGMLLAVAAPLSALWFFAYLLFFCWVLVTSVLLLGSGPRT